MNAAAAPAISAIVVAPFGFDDVRQLIRHLAAQTIRDRLEVVLVVPSRSLIAPDHLATLSVFGACQVIESAAPALTRGRAVGIAAAAAPVVVLTEDHCFPEPGWAEALVRAHEGPWAAVGPVFNVANPSPRAIAGCLMQYAPWVRPSAGDVEDLPGHNASYKRDIILQYGHELATMLTAESIMHWDLRRRGYRLGVAADARVRHVFMTDVRGMSIEAFYIGRGFGASRARHWGLGRRAAFVLASPLIPAIRLGRMVRSARRCGWGSVLPRIVPLLAGVLTVSAAGEMIGTAFGAGRAVEKGVELDTRRYRFVSAADRALWEVEPAAPPSSLPG